MHCSAKLQKLTECQAKPAQSTRRTGLFPGLGPACRRHGPPLSCLAPLHREVIAMTYIPPSADATRTYWQHMPQDPGIPEPTDAADPELQRHLTTLKNDFKKYDTANEDVNGSSFLGRFFDGPDGRVSADDLKAVVKDGGKSGDFTPAQVEAARYFLDHPEALAHLDTAAAPRNGGSHWERPDGLVGLRDVDAALQDTQTFAGGHTFISQMPVIPVNESSWTPQQKAAAVTLAAGQGLDPEQRADQQMFLNTLEAHKDDAAWLQGYLRALGGARSGELLYRSLTAGGRDQATARAALKTLKANQSLSESDLTGAVFKTSPASKSSVPLKTLIAADELQQTIEARRTTLSQAGPDSMPVDTSTYSSYDALLTVLHPDNAKVISETATRYGIPPALLSGTVASEMDFDHAPKDKLHDGLWRHAPDGLIPDSVWTAGEKVGPGAGITSVHADTLKWAVDYMKEHQVPGAAEAQAFWDAEGRLANAADFPQSVEAAAIVLAALTHLRTGSLPSDMSPQDMAVTWGAFRTGVIGHTPGGKGYTLEEFRAGQRTADDANKVVTATGDEHTRIGGNAYQSEPYFQYLDGALG
ncbi:hypothetical protein OOT46_03475 [Aquabacterium sp. A7-Y]|uniref:hypothetical protein n=1 Tax=Aquabacterium sp. A7-Y TaxID=1349605 RepID=UPI00223D469F|nr:hypothetical protein [Aquabacterium sp. A7-Y]MCW7536914.1 hypothetical protein [Aquabacterium sp. A7-Y]